MIFYKLLFFILFHIINGEMGPADIGVSYMQKCSDKQGDIDFNILHFKYNRTFATISFNMSLPYEFNDNLVASMSVSSMSNGAWKPNFYNVNIKNVCHSLKDSKEDVFKLLAKSANVRPQCPLPKGNYYIENNNYMAEGFAMPTNLLPYGKFKLDVLLSNKRKLGLCIAVFMDITPRRKNKKTKS